MRPEVKHLDYTQSDELGKHLDTSTYETVLRAVSEYAPRRARVLDVGSGAR